jgi:type I restriction enzyme, S subunit
MNAKAKERGLSSPRPQSTGGLENPSTVAEWTSVLVPDSLSCHSIGRENQIPSSEVKQDGRFPVVDQGQAFVTGYCDEAARVIRNDLPLVVFGDHTRCFKYVDFPFILGADGTKVLKPKTDLFDPKYFYFALRGLDIPNRGYNRHFAVLKEMSLPRPPLAEQRKIAGVLGLVQRAMEQQDRLIELTTELKKALLHQLFTQGLRGEPQKQTEIGPVPQSWEVVTIQDVCSLRSGGTPSKQKPEFWNGTIPWVSPKDMKKPRLSDVVDHISEDALADGSSLAPSGAVFVVIRGMILAKDVPVAQAEVPMAFNQDMKAMIPGARILPSFLLYSLVAFKQHLFEKVGRSAHGTMTLMSSEIAQFSIPLPNMTTQQEIASAIETVERKHEQHQRKHAALTALFRTLLHQLMTAQIRV